MFKNLQKRLYRDYKNLPGWRTGRRLVIIESDDWGSIRMPDLATYKKLLLKGIRVDNCPFNRFDSLASEDDLSALFEVLDSFRDVNGNPPIITANCVVANPDFQAIRQSGYKEYHYELFTDTLQRYPNHSLSFQLWKEGMERKLFSPQFHGREHLNVSRWMQALQLGLPETRFAFDFNLFGISTNITTEKRQSYLEAFATENDYETEQIRDILKDGLSLFRQIFGFSSLSFVAPNYVWPRKIEVSLAEQGVKYIQGQRLQFSHIGNEVSKVQKIPHFTGQRNAHGQIYTVRNCVFEPSLNETHDCVNECLAQIGSAFRCRKPAIITAHRVNFIGSIVQSNREKNLKRLNEMLGIIHKKWPDVEYMSTESLGNVILDGR